MKRLKKTAICIGLLATLSVVGCVCPPTGYHSGMRTSYIPNCSPYDNACDPVGCDPCGPVEACGIVEYSGNPCGPQSCIPQFFAPKTYAPKVVDYRNSFSNLGNGVLLFGRGVLDITAAPFVIAGNLLSSGCRYEVLTFCDDVVPYGKTYRTVDPCTSACSSGCETCSRGFTEGIQYSAKVPNRTTSRTTSTVALPRRTNNSVIQASYQEPTAPVRFVQPR